MTDSHVLFIDAYDSFSNNIIALLKDHLHVHVVSTKIDDPRFVLNDDAFHHYLNDFDAVVAGPGPGHPGLAGDVGLIGKLWCLSEDQQPPVLGICLGFQSLCLAYEATVARLREPRHGLVTPVTHCDRDIFGTTGNVSTTQYHSLHVQLGTEMEAASLWTPSRTCGELIPLAWDLSDPNNGPILMAARHCHKPLWGVQYHPESICTNEQGQELISRWWQEVCTWNAVHRTDRIKECKRNDALYSNSCMPSQINQPTECSKVEWTTLRLSGSIEVTDIVDALRDKHEPILLESGTRQGQPVNGETGRFSIIGLPGHSSKHVYSLDECERHMQQCQAVGGAPEIPFWGGLIGYISYEAGLETIDVPLERQHNRPQTSFTSIERSVIIDHVRRMVYVQSIALQDTEWVTRTAQIISGLARESRAPIHGPDVKSRLLYEPEEEVYRRKVRECQAHLRAGSSYELCLTDQTLICCSADPWTLYRRLRDTNPSPFGAYLCLKTEGHTGVSVISSSPERFLSWSRNGRYQFRPIKGTVKKTPGMTRAKAEELLASTKERAENLMIVDLIRHDLNGVVGVANVRVPKLLVVEEYETVFQLVSVVEGDSTAARPSVAALKASLPPGSMTGAPKKRSCELLSGIEGQEARGLYSGVLGYLDVGGGGDFSVVIRSAFKWSDEDDVWRIGAGGAVTALSEPKAEWDEMLAKREAVVNVFFK